MTVYYKMRQTLLQNATAILLQNASGFLLQNVQLYYKMRQLLQNASGFLLHNVAVLLQNETVITKCDVYYKLRQCTLEQAVTMQHTDILVF